MKDKSDSGLAPFPLAWLGAILLLTLCIMGIRTLEIRSMYDSLEDKNRDLRILELTETINYLDEVLTMSARMAAATGSLEWEKRYLSFEPKLSAAIQEAILLEPEVYQGEGARETNAANEKLVEMELRSFDWIREGRRKDAEELLSSPGYESQKMIYAQGMRGFSASIEKKRNQHLQFHRKIRTGAFWGGAVIFSLVFMLWAYVLRMVSQWQKTLAGRNKNLDRMVSEKTNNLNQSNEHLSLALSAAGMGMWDWEIEKDLFTWDENTHKLLGNKQSSENFEDFVQTVHPRDRERVRREVHLCLDKETDYETSFHILRPDGSIGVQSARGKVYRNSSGKPIKMTGAAWDITHQKKAQEAVHQSEINYRNMIESNTDGILIVGQSDGNIIFASRAAAKLFGRNVSDLVGTQFGFPIADEKISEINLIPANGKSCIVEFHVSGTQWEEKSAFLISLRDITARKELENKFLQAQKMEAVGQLTGGIAHDFNNLLTVINGYSELNIAALRADDPMRPQLEEILKAGLRAKSLTSRLLTFSRQYVFAPKIMDLNVLILDLEKMARRLISEDIEFVLLQADDLGLIKADPSQIEQVFINLVVNARDAMPKGGRITMETRNVDIPENDNTGGIPPGKYVLLTVSDNGAGMTNEVKEHLFEPFFTTKEKGKGTGLGLATCNNIVIQSGGSIRVLSELGQGSTFEIYFQRSLEKQDLLTLQKKSKDLPRGSETILLVEDEISVRKLASTLLTGQGYNVLEAENGEMALRVVRDQKENCPQLAVVDVVMPQMGGREFSDEVRFLCPKIKVLFVSGYTSDQAIRYGVEVAKTNFLQKPFTSKSLISKVREVLDEGNR